MCDFPGEQNWAHLEFSAKPMHLEVFSKPKSHAILLTGSCTINHFWDCPGINSHYASCCVSQSKCAWTHDVLLSHVSRNVFIYGPELKAVELNWVLCSFLDIPTHPNISNFQFTTKTEITNNMEVTTQNWGHPYQCFFLRILWCS